LDVGFPLIVMEVAGSRLTVRLRPKFLARLSGVAPLIAEPGSGLTVTTRQAWLGWGRYIYFRLPGWRPYRLWTPSREQARLMLWCLADAGFEVPVVESR
jgi:hypothetical protein